MNSLELSLQVFITLNGISHFVVDHVLVGDLQRNQELGSVGFPGEIR